MTITQSVSDDREQLTELLGGLSLTPYGIYWVLSAFAFAIGWLNWRTNGGLPFLGAPLAYLFDWLIRRYYRKRYKYSFEAAPSKTGNSSSRKAIIAVLVITALVVAWVIEKNIPLPIRLVLFLFGILVSWRGISWTRKGWDNYSFIHSWLGVLLMGASVLPLVLNIPSYDMYFGVDGILEIGLLGLAIIMIGVMEHLIIVRVCGSEVTL